MEPRNEGTKRFLISLSPCKDLTELPVFTCSRPASHQARRFSTQVFISFQVACCVSSGGSHRANFDWIPHSLILENKRSGLYPECETYPLSL